MKTRRFSLITIFMAIIISIGIVNKKIKHKKTNNNNNNDNSSVVIIVLYSTIYYRNLHCCEFFRKNKYRRQIFYAQSNKQL